MSSSIARSSVQCCLCLKLLDSVSHVKTCKHFYGSNCVAKRTILCELLMRRNVQLQFAENLSVYAQLSNANALLYASCSRLLIRIRTTEQELVKSLGVVDKYLGLLSPQPQSCALTQGQGTTNMEVDIGHSSNQCPAIISFV